MNHVVDCRTFLGALMRGTQVKPLICSLHLWTHLCCTYPLQLDDEKIHFKDELADVLVLPHILIYFLRWLTNLDYVRWVISYSDMNY